MYYYFLFALPNVYENNAWLMSGTSEECTVKATRGCFLGASESKHQFYMYTHNYTLTAICAVYALAENDLGSPLS